MKFICDDIVIRDVLDELKIAYCGIQKEMIDGYKFIHTKDNHFYFEESMDSTSTEICILEISPEEIWELDKFQSTIAIRKKRFSISDGHLSDIDNGDCFTYFRRSDDSDLDNCIKQKDVKRYREKKLELKTCDLYLLIPGKLEKKSGVWDDIRHQNMEVFDIFKENIDYCIRNEYKSDLHQKISRKCLGEIKIEIQDYYDKEKYIQDAIVGIVKYETGFCILEIIVQNCFIGGNKLLNYYCGDEITYLYNNKRLSLNELLCENHINRFGKKRSMVFSYGDIIEKEIVHALANEEFPMGEIGGALAKKVANENIAQYNTAEVYVSQETMFEKCKDINVFSDMRLSYHAIEIFFVELILFQDAAIDKIFVNLQLEGKKQNTQFNISESTRQFEQISFDMSEALNFSNYEQFKFPTVRESAKNVAKNFGIDFIFEKYEMNKQLLEGMISANKRRIQEQQDTIKNQFLMLISALATVGTLGQIIYTIINDKKGGMLSYVLSSIIVVVGFTLYKIAVFAYCKVSKLVKGRKKNICKKKK